MDSVCITMPDDFYEFILALPIIQDYQLSLAIGAQQGKREITYQVTFRMNENFAYFEPCMRVVADNVPIFDYSGWRRQQRRDYDCFLTFDKDFFRRAEIVARSTNHHITMGMSVLLGAGAGPRPVLKALEIQPSKNPCDVLILAYGWNDFQAHRMYDFILDNTDCDIICDPRPMTDYENNIAAYVEYVNTFNFVIGPKSPATYLAATLNKGLIELYPSVEEAVIYKHQGISNYNAICGNIITADFVWSVWEGMWPSVKERLSITRSQEEQHQMAPVESTVDSAEEKSSSS